MKIVVYANVPKDWGWVESAHLMLSDNSEHMSVAISLPEISLIHTLARKP